MHVPELRQLRAEMQPLSLSFILVILEAVKLQQQSRWHSHKIEEACINTMYIELYGFPYIKSLRFGLKFVTYHSLGHTDYEKIQQISIPTLFHPQTLAPCCLLQLSVHGILQTRILKWDSPDKNTEMGSHSLLQGIFPDERSNLSFLHCRQIIYLLSHQGSPQ